jgi:hypothetical protein
VPPIIIIIIIVVVVVAPSVMVRGSVVFEAQRYKLEGHGFEILWDE